MKLLSLFSGIGAFEKALDRLEIPYELVAYCEIDKYASKSYSAIHGVPESMNLGDITKVDEKALPKNIDLVTYGFPCQDISLAGKQKGLFNEDGTQTRSGLFFEALRIIEETQPRVAIAENVKNLTGKKFEGQFKIVLDSLEQAGYNNYWQVLNAKDYGIPQNRERVFIVSIRKDIDTGFFRFPEGFPLELRLKDVLEDVVDEKYYLKPKDTNVFKMFDSISTDTNGCIQVGNLERPTTHDFSNRVYSPDGIARTLMGSGGNQNDKSGQYLMNTEKVINVGNVNPSGKGQNGAVIDSEGLARTITQEKGEGQKILVREATKAGYAEAYEGDSINLEQPNSTTRRGRVGHGVAQTLTTSPQQAVVERETISYTRNHPPKATDVSACLQASYYKGFSNNNPYPAVVEPFIVASRGRNPENPSDRTVGSPTVQRLEPNSQGICNTLTTVQKDNYVAEPTETALRIRKLTPKECFRLMDFDDADFEKAEALNSNTQLYKQAGNSIVVAVPQYIIKALFEANIFIDKEKEEMELKVKTPTFPEVIEFNFDELKQEITERASTYVSLVYSEEQIQDAKKDRATLNKFVKALSDERIKIKKECLKPYEDFEAKIKELDKIVNVAINNIDAQVKGYEEKQKQEKKAKIEEYFAERYLNSGTPAPEFFTLERIFDEKWLNASVSIKSIEDAIDAKAEQVKNDLATLANLPEFGFEATEVYKSTLDLGKAINEGQKLADMAKRKAEAERLKAAREAEAEAWEQAGREAQKILSEEAFPADAMNPPEPPKQWVSFKALLTVDQARELKRFFDDRCIEFEAI